MGKNKLDQRSNFRTFFSNRDTSCSECQSVIEVRELIVLAEGNEAICLTCADMDHLVYLPAGDAALTRRATKHSSLSTIVYSFSKARKRNERQGVLVESQALKKAEEECLADADLRALHRERDAERRQKLDKQYIENFTERIKKLFPKCPAKEAKEISDHACMKYSGRVGRSADAKKHEDYTINLAVTAHIRHVHTNYDSLLAEGYDRYDARRMIDSKISEICNKWKG